MILDCGDNQHDGASVIFTSGTGDHNGSTVGAHNNPTLRIV